MPYAKKKDHRGNAQNRALKTKRRRKDLDEVDEDLKPQNIDNLLNQEIDLDKPGNAQFYCVHCARYFIDNQALDTHFRSKPHKRRLKDLETEPYTIEESERAAGKGNYIEPKRRKIETQPSKKMEDDTIIKEEN